MLVAFVRDVFVAVAILIALIALAYPPGPEIDRARDLALDPQIRMSPSATGAIPIAAPPNPVTPLAPR